MPGNARGISIRVRPLSGRAAGGQKRHDLRDPAHVPEYVDQARTRQNRQGRDVDLQALRSEISSHRAAAGQQKLRADSRVVVAGIITFGTEAQAKINGLDRKAQEDVFRDVAKAIARQTGHPLLTVSVHRDESAIHAHFMLRGYVHDPATSKETPWRKTPKDLKAIQDVAAETVKALGIERGFTKEQRLRSGDTKADVIYKTVRQLHDQLPADYEAARARVVELEARVKQTADRLKTAQEKLQKASASEKTTVENLAKLAKRVQTYETRAQAAKADAVKAEAEATRLRSMSDLAPPQKVTVLAKDDRGLVGKLFRYPPTKEVLVYPAKAAQTAVGNINEQLKTEQVRADTAETERKQWQDMAVSIERFGSVGYSNKHKLEDWPLYTALRDGRLEVKYGVVCAISPGKILIPRQKASARQKAAALYSHGRQEGWAVTRFHGLDQDTAKEIVAMAKADGRLDAITFDNKDQQKLRDAELPRTRVREHEHEHEMER